MNKVRVAVIGVGNIGSAHTNSLYSGKIENAELAAICDNDKNKENILKEKFPDVKFYNDYNLLLNDDEIDAVIISVPHPLHSEIALKALKHNKNVLTEKPADIRADRAADVIKAAKLSKSVFAIMFNQRTNPLFKKAKQIVSSGELGELKRAVWIVTNWYRSQSYYDSGSWRATWAGEGGGVLLNQAPHNLDILQWICGMPESVSAKTSIAKYHNIEVEDDAVINISFKNGAIGTFITSTGEYPGTNRLEISGTGGKIVIENGKLCFYKLKTDEKTVRFSDKNMSPKIETEYSEILPAEKETAHRGIIQNFVNAILFGEELISPGEEGINELLISNAAYLSSWNDSKSVPIPFDNKKFDKMLSALQKKSSYKPEKGSISNYSGDYSSRWSVKW